MQTSTTSGGQSVQEAKVDFLKAYKIVLTRFRSGALTLFALVLGILVRLLSPFLIIRISPIKCRSFGNFLLEPELRILEALEDSIHSPSIRRLDIFFCGGGTQGLENSALRKLWSQKIVLVESRLVASTWSKWTQNRRMQRHINRSSCRCRDERNLWDKYESRMELSSKQIEDIQNVLEELGVKRNQPIALLHIRDTSYDQFIKAAESNFDYYRNASPINHQLAVDELNNRGFAVLAIGNQGSWSRELSDVIDYSGSAHRSELRDVSVGAVASLYLGSEAAPSNLPLLFRKPQLLTNNTRIAELSTSSQLKMHVFKEHRLAGQALTQSRIWNGDLADYEKDFDLTEAGLELIDNTSDEIRAGLLDLLQVMSSEEKYSEFKSEVRQQQFWEVFASGVKRNPNFRERHGELRALVAPSFLRKRLEWTL